MRNLLLKRMRYYRMMHGTKGFSDEGYDDLILSHVDCSVETLTELVYYIRLEVQVDHEQNYAERAKGQWRPPGLTNRNIEQLQVAHILNDLLNQKAHILRNGGENAPLTDEEWMFL